MAMAKMWTAEEYDQLSDEWGQYSIKTIAERHNRSPNAIKIKAQRRSLGQHLLADDRVSINQIFSAFKVQSYTYLLGRMVKAGLKIHYHKIDKARYKVIKIEEFWEFIEKHRSMLDFSKLEKNALGIEPSWVEAVRREDFKRRCSVKPKNCQWTQAEDAELLRLVQMQRYSYSEIAHLLHRSCGAVSRRLHDLGVKDRPLKADNHVKWTDAELKTMSDMIKAGSNYENIGRAIGRSAKAVQGRVYNMYLTEQLDKVREMMNGGEWGDNRPERQLKHKNILRGDEKQDVKNGLSRLVCLLTYRSEQIAKLETHYGWQHKQCSHWHNGCDAGESDCTSCTHFRRKEPE